MWWGDPSIFRQARVFVDDMSPFLMQLVWVLFRYLKLVTLISPEVQEVDVEIC